MWTDYRHTEDELKRFKERLNYDIQYLGLEKNEVLKIIDSLFINWVVNVYMDIEGKREHVDSIVFGDEYEKAKEYYWEHKANERKQGKYLELKPYQGIQSIKSRF